ncbi:enoyl-CoA hydratase/isomerase family protein [Gryllotalpicola protaetiae]|uniref:Enoyl-CoA hydratase/isomerase family protein n=1 Tax=Gryllotalpicola protaetiae TaxID=2419771 RepID=A0A387BGK7_9MICO|nr:enoyl-CoA hydratase/isomerase family protein [Gryllotalpicola protaetiae]AYG03145.1 enoyl-CoA hydratase/isomerase family protein [Gryllotalpicola protaetiae]
MDEVKVDVEQDGAVRRITINRPDKRNALSRAMFAELEGLFRQPPPAGERVTVIQTVGHVFCSGIDLNERLAQGAPPLDDLCEAISSYPLPVVAIMQGDAIAGGAFLALACDFVVAAEKARLWVSLVQIGLAPPWPLTRRLAELAGPAFARQLVLLGDPVEASRLAAANMIASAVPAEDLSAEAERIIGRLAQNAPLSLRAIKATLAAKDYAELDHDNVVELIHTARDSEDGREGVKARLERRMPVYAGK